MLWYNIYLYMSFYVVDIKMMALYLLFNLIFLSYIIIM